MKIIRSDTLNINADHQEQRDALSSTLEIYRSLVRDLMVLINARWPVFQVCSGDAIIKSVEELIHPTTKRPVVKHAYFHRKYYKFPSYLRRVAIMDAAGQVRSFHTRFDEWLDSGMKNKPPKLTCSTSTFPSLYKGQCVKFSADGSVVSVKVFERRDWLWREFNVSGTKRFAERGKNMSPLLVLKNKKWFLSLPSKIDVALKDKNDFSGKVLSVDVGINTTATCAVVDKTGTVHQRVFLSRCDKDREYRLMNRIRTKARKASRHGNKLASGFCSQDHRRLKQLANNEAHQISRRIVRLAAEYDCDAVVLENLKGWKPKAGRKRSTMKARFHRWYHRMLSDRIKSKALELGIRCVRVFARGTSMNAYDGSGQVMRGKSNYALCRFSTGKRYNADLNAAYNIAARGIIKLYYPKLCKQLWSQGKPNACPTTGSPLTLSSLWLLNPQAG